MKKRIISLMLSLTLALTMIPLNYVYAEDSRAVDKGIVLDKSVTYSGDGKFEITLEGYATGAKIVSTVTKTQPTDVILLLDQSSSMIEEFMFNYSYRFDPYTGSDGQNENLYQHRHNNNDSKNLYYKLPDGSYASVSVTKTGQTMTFASTKSAANAKLVYNNHTYTSASVNLFSHRDNLYIKKSGAPENQESSYLKVYQAIGTKDGAPYYYNYYLEDGTLITSANANTGKPIIPENLGYDPYFYIGTENNTNATYTYYYTDEEGEHEICQSSGSAAVPSGVTFYKEKEDTLNGKEYRKNSLQTAVRAFCDNVEKKSRGADGTAGTEDDVDHRIAIVGYAEKSGAATEIYVGAQKYGYPGSGLTEDAFQDMSTSAGVNNIHASISAYNTKNATYIGSGMDLVNVVLNKDSKKDDGRGKVLIVFTDGIPGTGKWEYPEANKALSLAKTMKENGITIYTVGIQDGADATNRGIAYDTDQYSPAAANYFLHHLSSNYPHTSAMEDASVLGQTMAENVDPYNGGQSYYLSAHDSASLKDIFLKISEEIESGGATTEVGPGSVAVDFISPQFQLLEGAKKEDVTVQTAAYLGKDSEGNDLWADPDDFTDADVILSAEGTSVNGVPKTNGSVSVSNFDYSNNWVGFTNGTVPHGKKLIFKFTVEENPDFLGGNGTSTNTGAQLEIHDKSDQVVDTVEFDNSKPDVNVSVKSIEVNVEAADKNVYLSDSLTGAQLKKDAVVTVGDVALNINDVTVDGKTITAADNNYGLEPWQTALVKIDIVIKDKNGKIVTGISNIKDDQEYTIRVTVEPKSEADPLVPGDPAAKQVGEGTADIRVFKPVLTFSDLNVYMGGAYPELSETVEPTDWIHSETSTVTNEETGEETTATQIVSADDVVMMSETAPELRLSYDMPSAGIITSSADVDVNVSVSMDDLDVIDYVEFKHTPCVGDPKLNPTFNPCCDIEDHAGSEDLAEFKLHVFTPVVTLKDTFGYYGGDNPADFGENGTDPFLDGDAEWIHAATPAEESEDSESVVIKSTSVDMANSQPTLGYEYTADENALDQNGKIDTLKDIKVDAGVLILDEDGKPLKNDTDKNIYITNAVTFEHTDCESADFSDEELDGNEAWIHVKSCELTVEKKLNISSDENDIYGEDSFVFKVTGPDYSQEVVLQGGETATLKNLKVGAYTVSEDADWSWRYKKLDPCTATLEGSSDKDHAKVTFTNTLKNKRWLTVSEAVKNIFSKLTEEKDQ